MKKIILLLSIIIGSLSAKSQAIYSFQIYSGVIISGMFTYGYDAQFTAALTAHYQLSVHFDLKDASGNAYSENTADVPAIGSTYYQKRIRDDAGTQFVDGYLINFSKLPFGFDIQTDYSGIRTIYK